MAREQRKYSSELKSQAVQDYLAGKGSLRYLCKQYGIRDKKSLRQWIDIGGTPYHWIMTSELPALSFADFSSVMLLLLDNNERFSFYLTGNSDTNILKSELTRRLRLHRLAHAYVLMLNSGVRVFRDQKPNLFSPDGFTGGYFHTPTFYSSREVKETGLETLKIRGSRMVGTLLSPSGIFVTYSGAQNLADWDYRAELRVKSIHVNMLCNNRLSGHYKSTHVHGLMLNQDMELFYQLISTSDTSTRCFSLWIVTTSISIM